MSGRILGIGRRTAEVAGAQGEQGEQGPASSIHEHFTIQDGGTLTVADGVLPICFLVAVELLGLGVIVGTAPLGAAAKFDARLSGTTIFTTQANRPQVASGQTVSSLAVPDVTAIPAFTPVLVDVKEIGSTQAGGRATLAVRYREA